MSRYRWIILALASAGAALAVAGGSAVRAGAATPTYNINTLAGKVASVNGTAGLQIRMSAFLQEEADAAEVASGGPANPAITPTYVLSSPLDGTSVLAPGCDGIYDAVAVRVAMGVESWPRIKECE
jgi:hypothetical protein